MRLVFRVDASHSIGTGHVMRCSAIIEEAISRNISCAIVGHMGGIKWLENRLTQLGVKLFEDCSEFQISKKSDVLIIDSYRIPVSNSFIQPTRWKSVVNIADEETPNYSSSLVIHPGIDSIKEKQSGGKFLTGPKYIPLRRDIQKSNKYSFAKVKKVVVFGGGSDKFKLASAVAGELKNVKQFESAYFLTDLKDEISSIDSRFQVVEFGPALDSFLADADLVFTTASTSSLEVVAREIPLAVCSSVDNQKSYLKALVDRGLAVGVGSLNNSETWKLEKNVIQDLFTDPNLRFQMREKSSGFLDLLGSHRIVNEIQNL